MKKLMSPKANLKSNFINQEKWYTVNASAKSADAVDVMIFDEIGGWGITANQFAKELIEKATDKKLINVHINSLGGDVLEGTAIYNLLLNHPAKIHVYIAGIAASMASVIAMAGDVVHIPENAWLMVHKPWGIQGGNADDMRDYADFLDQFEAGLIKAYQKKSGKTPEEIAQLLTQETWLMGQQAIDFGLADKLTKPVEVSAKLNSQRSEDFLKMPKQINALLKPKGQGSDTPTPQNPAAPTPSAAVPNVPDAKIIAEQVLASERTRRDEIKAAFKGFDQHSALLNACLDDMKINAAAAKDQLLAALGAGSQPAQGGFNAAATAHVGNGNIVRDGLVNMLSARAGLEPLQKDNGYKGLSLVEMARMSLTERGISAYGMDRMQVVAMAFTHTNSDFGNILQDVARKSLLMGAQEAEESFQKWTKKGTLSDFKIDNRVGLDSFPSLDKVPEGGEYKSATLSDTGEIIQLATYGKLFSISRQAVINDNLNAFTNIPKGMGRAAMRTVGNLVYAVLMTPPNMKDGKALFHADHKNLLAGAALSVDALDAAATAMALQKDGSDVVLNIEPSFLIVPRASKGRAQQLMTSIYDPDSTGFQETNIVSGLAQVIADARIDAALSGGAPLPWFLVAGSGFDTIEVAYLDGNDAPTIEQQAGWTVDGAEFKVRIDAGVSPLSYRTLIKNPGSNS